MRKTVVSALAGAAIVGVLLLAFAGSMLSRRSVVVSGLQSTVRELTAERDSLLARLGRMEQQLAELQTATPTSELFEPSDAPLAAGPVLSSEVGLPPDAGPVVTTNANGRLTYFFRDLYGADGAVIARDAEFRELLGKSKLSFRTSTGVRYLGLDEVHPAVVRSLGYDPDLLKEGAAKDLRLAQIRVAQAQELRKKAAAAFAENQKTTAERLRAEAAMREAEARERMAAAAERSANAVPRTQIIRQKPIIIMPYGSRIQSGGTVGIQSSGGEVSVRGGGPVSASSGSSSGSFRGGNAGAGGGGTARVEVSDGTRVEGSRRGGMVGPDGRANRRGGGVGVGGVGGFTKQSANSSLASAVQGIPGAFQ